MRRALPRNPRVTWPIDLVRRLVSGGSLNLDGVGGGRVCPVSYRVGPERLRRSEDGDPVDTLFVVGGLYGNPHALAAVEARAAQEPAGPKARVVFNGDFNFFNASPEAFAQVNEAVQQRHTATAGNVEIEVATPSDGSCGCAYPAYVSDGAVERSNEIVAQLRATASSPDFAGLTGWLSRLPKFLTVRVGQLRVGVIHGDPDTLAGWAFSVEALDPPDTELQRSLGCADDPTFKSTTEEAVRSYFEHAAVDVFACTHTCLPFAQLFDTTRPAGAGLVVNNGSAGMANFSGTSFGLMTRLSTLPHAPKDALYGVQLGDVRVDAIPVRFDHDAWMADFLARWPPASPAHTSYFGRISTGPQFTVRQAARRGVAVAGSGVGE